MKLNSFRKNLTEWLSLIAPEDASFEADCILSDALGCGNAQLPLYFERELDETLKHKVIEKAARRIDGEPLQYVLGEWDFCGLPFFVGPGVLIPRPETEQLVELTLDRLKDVREPKVLDLCAGSGCIGVAIAKQRPDADVTLLEESDEAMAYLQRNIKRNLVNNTSVFQGDLFIAYEYFRLLLPTFDAIVSNPPYIKTAELSSLQSEVRREPVMALDGGADGLRFYRAIAEHYAPLLAENGFIAVEIGEEQGSAVTEIFGRAFRQTEVFRDYSGLDRMVLAEKRKE